MRVVNVRDLKFIKYLNKGSYSHTYLVLFEGCKYVYKEFKNIYPFVDSNVWERVGNLTEIKFPEGYFPPLYVVEEGFANLGYLTDYNEDLEEILDCFTRRQRIILMDSARNRLDILHNDLKFVHGDAHFGNVLCNKVDLTSTIFDFDLSFKIGETPTVMDDYNIYGQYYLKYHPFDKNLDAYLFNLSTLYVLNNKYEDLDELVEAIRNDSYDIPEMNKEVKKLSKELLLGDTRKPYSGEYITDYLL